MSQGHSQKSVPGNYKPEIKVRELKNLNLDHSNFLFFFFHNHNYLYIFLLVTIFSLEKSSFSAYAEVFLDDAELADC